MKKIIYILLFVYVFSFPASLQSQHDHDHGHDHGHDSCDGHDEIVLNQQQLKVAAIKAATASSGSLDKKILLSGEIKLNSDTLVNHVSKAPGIVVELKAGIGDYVRKGDILAVIDSAELGQAKSEFYEIFNEVGCTLTDLQRFRDVAANTTRLLDLLEKTPQISDLQKTKFGDMSDYGAKLLQSYAEFIVSRKAFQRKDQLHKDKIVSENDFLSAQSTYEKAMAEYFSNRDNARFELKQKLLDLERLMKVNEFKLRTAERKLQLLGLSHAEITEIRAQGAKIQQDCTSPDCKDCALYPQNPAHARDDGFSRVMVKAGRSGTVTFRDLSLGEEVEKNRILFTVADTSNLWAELKASITDYPLIKPGMPVTMQAPDGFQSIGKIILVKPTVDEKAQNVAVRVALNNETSRWLPGSFISGSISIAAENVPLLVQRNAVQIIDGNSVIFIPTQHGFSMKKVKTGREDAKHIEILEGLNAGEKYVVEGAFTLKSMKVTSTLDPHAGHGH